MDARRIAAAAKRAEPALLERLALSADALASGLERSGDLVAWDREQLIGQLQTRLRTLSQTRSSAGAARTVRVVERRAQPLEAVDLAWKWLRRGACVRVEYEQGVCAPVVHLLEGFASALPSGALQVAASGGIAEEGPEVVGVTRGHPRVALIDEDADRELSAYVLARTSLRRTGLDPRAVKVAYVAGTTELLQRHLTRLWVGVKIGPPQQSTSFAGPVPADIADEYLEACHRWGSHADVRTLSDGALLDRTNDPRTYVAPALFFTSWPLPELERVGPMLVVVSCSSAEARAGMDAALRSGGQAVRVGGRSSASEAGVRHIRGALLVERLPPGMPDPRPV